MTDAIKSRWIAAFFALGLVACGDGVVADGERNLYFTPWNTDQVQPRIVDAPKPRSAPQDEANYEEVVRGFSSQAPTLLERPDVVGVLGPIEQSFLLSGNYMQLIDLYRTHYEQHGPDSVAAPALAWAYLQVGNEPRLQALKEELLEVRPDDPLTWVIVGNIHLRRADRSVESAHRALEAFERVFELDPNFGGFKASDAEGLRRQIETLRQRVPDLPESQVAALDEPPEQAPMHHTEGSDRAELPADDDPTAMVDSSPTDPALADTADGGDEDDTDESTAVDERTETEEIEESIEIDDPVETVDDRKERAQIMDAQAAHFVVRGQQAFQRGSDHYQEAQQYFRQALERDPDNIDAGIGLLRIAARTGAHEDMLRNQVDGLADHSLSASQAYELGLFCLRRLNDRDRATSLLERVQQLDPSFAQRVGVDALLAP